jgi:hypothetical protein
MCRVMLCHHISSHHTTSHHTTSHHTTSHHITSSHYLPHTSHNIHTPHALQSFVESSPGDFSREEINTAWSVAMANGNAVRDRYVQLCHLRHPR